MTCFFMYVSVLCMQSAESHREKLDRDTDETDERDGYRHMPREEKRHTTGNSPVMH